MNMSMRWPCWALLFFLVLLLSDRGHSQRAETDKESVYPGNLSVKLTGTEVVTVFRGAEEVHTASKDHRFLLVGLNVKNLGPNPNCTDFSPALQVKTTEQHPAVKWPLKRTASEVLRRISMWGTIEKPRFLRLLSGAETRVTYVFELTDIDTPDRGF